MVTTTNTTAAATGLMVLLLLSSPAFAQQRLELQFGVRAGVPVTDLLESDTRNPSIHETFDRAAVTIGPTFGALLYNRLLIQLDAMYKPVRMRIQSTTPAGAPIFESRAASFELPLVFDYFFLKGNRRPYAGVGMMAAHIVTGTIESRSTAAGAIDAPFEGQFFLKNQLPAYVATGGVEWTTNRLAIRPEVRYTHWHRKAGLQFQPTQVEFSVGLSLHR